MSAYVIQLNAKSSPTATISLYFAIGAGIAFSDFQYVPGGAMSWASPTQKITLSDTGMTASAVDQGAIKIANMADTLNSSGPLDGYLRRYGFQGQVASLYYCPDTVWANKVLVDSGVLEQPVAAGLLGATLNDSVSFPLRDWRSTYTQPLQATRYLGDSTPLEGGTELAGKPKPILYGHAYAMPAVLTSPSLLIYQVCDKAVSIGAVEDGGVLITFAADYTGNMSGFQAATVSAGHYISYSDDTYGTFVRLGSTPVKKFVVEATEGTVSTFSSYSHSALWSRVSTNRLGRSISSTSVTAFQALDATPCGFWWGPNDNPTQKDALDQILSSCWGYEVYTPASGQWSVGKLAAPDTNNLVTLQVLEPTTRMGALDRKLVSAAVARPDWTPGGAPPSLVTLQYDRVYDVHSQSDFNGAAPSSTVAVYLQPYRAQTYGTANGLFANQPTVTLQTGYYFIAPGSTPTVDQEAQILFNLMQQYTGSFQVTFIPKVYPTPDIILPGAVVKMILPRYGDPAHTYYRALQSGLKVDQNGPQMTLVMGLES